MLLNISNHPFERWDAAQQDLANRDYASVEDMPFPAIDPAADAGEVAALARRTADEVAALAPAAVHLMGETTFCFALGALLQARGIVCIASTTVRDVVETAEGKISRFRFVRFRQYPVMF